jgi:hypothetical protein
MQAEFEITKKLLKNFHLNVEERKLLPDGKVKISTIKKIISKILRDVKWFPENWRPDSPFAGALLELQFEDKIIFYKKSEVSISNYEIINKEKYSNFDKAIKNFIIFMFNHEIDGIEIDYES